jgi:hypothetical protein
MPKDIAWGPVGRPKAPHGGGTFAADTPQVFYWAYTLPLMNNSKQGKNRRFLPAYISSEGGRKFGA